MPRRTSYTFQHDLLYSKLPTPTNGAVFVVHLPVNQQVSLRVAMDVISFGQFGRMGEESLMGCHAGDGFTVLKGDCSVKRATTPRQCMGMNASWPIMSRLEGRGDSLDPHRDPE